MVEKCNQKNWWKIYIITMTLMINYITIVSEGSKHYRLKFKSQTLTINLTPFKWLT